MKILLRATTVERGRFSRNFFASFRETKVITATEPAEQYSTAQTILDLVEHCNANEVEIDRSCLYGEELTKLFYECTRRNIRILAPEMSQDNKHFDRYAVLADIKPVFLRAEQ